MSNANKGTDNAKRVCTMLIRVRIMRKGHVLCSMAHYPVPCLRRPRSRGRAVVLFAPSVVWPPTRRRAGGRRPKLGGREWEYFGRVGASTSCVASGGEYLGMADSKGFSEGSGGWEGMWQKGGGRAGGCVHAWHVGTP